MKLRLLVPVLLAGLILSISSGCAVIGRSTTQMVVVRSVPEGAVGLVNGIEVGKTPFKIRLKRSNTATIEIRKDGFESATVVVMPTSNGYDQRYIRWGLDYELGAATDLTPSDINVALLPAVPASESGDHFEQMSKQVQKADAMLAAKQISAADHKYIVDQIVKSYAK